MVSRDANNEAVSKDNRASANSMASPELEGGNLCTGSLNWVIEDCAGKLGVRQVGVRQVGVRQVGVRQVGLRQVGVRQVGPLEAGTAQVLAAQVEAAQIHAVEDSTRGDGAG